MLFVQAYDWPMLLLSNREFMQVGVGNTFFVFRPCFNNSFGINTRIAVFSYTLQGSNLTLHLGAPFAALPNESLRLLRAGIVQNRVTQGPDLRSQRLFLGLRQANLLPAFPMVANELLPDPLDG